MLEPATIQIYLQLHIQNSSTYYWSNYFLSKRIFSVALTKNLQDFEVLTAVLMMIQVLWAMMLCQLTNWYWH